MNHKWDFICFGSLCVLCHLLLFCLLFVFGFFPLIKLWLKLYSLHLVEPLSHAVCSFTILISVVHKSFLIFILLRGQDGWTTRQVISVPRGYVVPHLRCNQAMLKFNNKSSLCKTFMTDCDQIWKLVISIHHVLQLPVKRYARQDCFPNAIAQHNTLALPGATI